MEKIFNDCYELDKRCYVKFELTEDILMENAAQGLQNIIQRRVDHGSKILIVAGPGNNGADGITLARRLYGDYEIYLYLPYGAKSNMAKIQLQRARQLGVATVEHLPEQTDVIVDALFGAGLNKALDIDTIDLIDSFNSKKSLKIACDIPSGLDSNGNPNPITFKADITVTMGALKKALFSDFAKDFVGEIEVVDLGVSRKLYEAHTDMFLLQKSEFNPPLRNHPSSHKGQYGHLYVVAGKKSGAAILCASAALRFGAGLVSLISEHKLEHIPYSLMLSDRLPDNASAVALGMGLGGYDPILTKSSIIKNDISVLIDADICYTDWVKEVLKKCTKTVVTPHPKEFSALLKNLDIADVSTSEIQQDRFGWAKRFSKEYPSSVLVLKGANTIIAHKGIIYINNLGNQVLSQAGSGDILSGLISSLLAQGYTPLNAAINGSLALSLCALNYKGANFSATAEDLIKEIRWIS